MGTDALSTRRWSQPPRSSSAPILDGPVDFIRWEQLRDGIEDYEYLTMLRERLEQRGKVP